MASVVVAITGAVLFGRKLGPPNLKIAADPIGTPTPTVVRPDRRQARVSGEAFSGQGSWVMSSLPECFVETSLTRGSLAEVQHAIPPAAQRIAPGTVIRRADCTLTVRADDLLIARGADRLRVPPEAGLYRKGALLTLVAHSGDRVEVRTY
jgi:hypothetical protein